ncbi:hypothetical protein JG688_00000625 [Phytophthora aleatoria]|uniref:Carbohydrate esterase n=1 Tax=Phytophthora aleatoria TaxID=2496075 RepID=A0A8J5J4V8_9STRA|nr:hypothetical protein JG688_00000625 [Phytophthora aleatoria]
MVFRLANAAAVLLAATALLSVPPATAESSCTLSDSETCAVDSLTPSDDDGSVIIYPGGNTRCAFDDYTDSETTFSTNSTYFFQVFPNGGSDKSKLMIFFQGGGACADADTCAFGLQCSLGASATFTTAATASSAGVLDRSISDNMFKDWNIVFIPYCTGDIHIGNRVTAAYESGIEVLLGNSQCLGLDYAMHMNGYNNTMAVLDWALENYPDVDNLIVGGESAGSLGAQVHSAKIAEMWDVDGKGSRFSVLADSYVGVVPEDHPAAELLVYYGACTNDFGLSEDIVAACEAGTATTIEMIDALLKAQPEGNWLFIDSKGDKTQRYFYALVEEGILGYPFSDLISEGDFFSNMSTILDSYRKVSSRITTFYVESTKHVFLADSNFTSYESDEGLLLGDVINEWLISNSSLNSNSTETPTGSPSATTATPGATTATPTATTATPGTTSSPSTPPSPTFLTSVPQTASESICTLSDSETCAVDTLAPSDDDGSVLIYPGGNTRCAFDDYTDSETTFSTNSTYFFQVFPNGGSDKSKLMIFFQGGGACTDEETCSFGLQCSLGASATLTTVATSSSAGVLNRSISDNMFKDWNIVFIPYCTGDVHAGNRILEPYESSTAELLGEPQCLGLNYTMYLNGYNNTQAALDWALENYPDVDNLIVGGESAGSLGAQLHSAHIAELWSVSAKGTRFSVIADSYVGAVPANHTGSQSLHFTGVCGVNLGMPATVVADCDAETATTVEMTESLIEDEPQGNWLFINSKGDLTQRYFYALLEEGIQGYPFTDLHHKHFFVIYGEHFFDIDYKYCPFGLLGY